MFFPYHAAPCPRAQDFLTRTPGEAVYAGSLSPQQRAARQLGRDLGGDDGRHRPARGIDLAIGSFTILT